MVEHSGSLSRGHYVAYVKTKRHNDVLTNHVMNGKILAPTNGKWNLFGCLCGLVNRINGVRQSQN